MRKRFKVASSCFALLFCFGLASTVHAATGNQSKDIGTQAARQNETAANEVSFSAEEAKKGMKIFSGQTQLKNGGAACISCHSATGIKTPGGGNLGPDLTKVAERFGGGEKLMAWMGASASETMSPIYQKHPIAEDELHALAAFLVAESKHEVQASGGQITFLGLGIAGAVVVAILLAVIWGNRFQAVRTPLVEGKNTKRTGDIR